MNLPKISQNSRQLKINKIIYPSYSKLIKNHILLSFISLKDHTLNLNKINSSKKDHYYKNGIV